ncbi:hypothetical protein ACH6EH_10490 [Paenibacillus sp. JSM ZJ436]|uniref:hypothetical protein n=1 Tax=Paenibacillus sp. JSM ZJ436 TaxID=3376190 RepID=UPI0037A19115
MEDNKLRPYSHKHFKYDGRSEIHGSINTDDDVKKIFDGCDNIISYMITKHLPHKLQREDIVIMEMELGKYEIALNKICQLPHMFSFSLEDRALFKTKYSELVNKVHDFDLMRVSWN